MTDYRVPSDDDTIRDDSPRARGLPEKIGQYTIKREIARGGMGVVFEAVQAEPRRAVAVKVMKESIASDEALRRFRYESQLLARLRHPGIAQVYEAGTHDTETGALPYFAMEYIPNAKPITQFADDKKLDRQQRLELFARVCDAVHHGHQRGIIHRDLKPGNILVDSHGNPRIIDFGVARATDSDMATIQTEVGQIIGSIQYMSPEQFDADPHDIDTRSDVYALGVILYELLTGVLPYDVRDTTILEAAKIVRDQEPPRLSRTDAALGGEIETITFTALQKDRDRRYQSANGLAADVRRYLNGEAIAARAPSLAYQIRVFARRHKAFMGAAAVVMVTLAMAAVVSTMSWVKADRERARAEAQTERTEAAVGFLKAMVSSAIPSSWGVDISLQTVLDVASEKVGEAFPDDPATEADLRQTLASGYLNLGLWPQIERHLTAARDINRSVFGPTHERTRQSLSRLASLYSFTGQLDEREQALRELIAARSVLGDDHEETLESRASLAIVLAQNDKLGEAREISESLLELRRRELGDDAELTIDAKVTVAVVALWQERLEEAGRLAQDAFDECERAFEPDHWMIRRSRSLLAAVDIARERFDDAYALYDNTSAPEDFGVVSSFQGEVGSPFEGNNLYVFWEAW